MTIGEKEIQIEPVELSDKEMLVALYEKHLNYGRSIRCYMDALFDGKQYLGLKASAEQEILAVFLCSEGIGFTLEKNELTKQIKRLAGDLPVYSLDMIYTDKAMRHHGLQSEFAGRIKPVLRQRGAGYLLVEQWVKAGNSCPEYGLDHIFPEKIGLGFYQDFYKGIEQEEIFCPVCGDGCKCGASIVLYKIT